MSMLVNPSRFAAGGAYDTAFPPMTANNLPSGYLAFASGEAVSYEAFRAFDQGPGAWVADSDVSYIGAQFPSQRKASAYSVKSFVGGSGDPLSFRLDGSNNGSSWTTLDSRPGVPSWAGYETRTYTISSPAGYEYYKLVILVTQGGANARLSELSFSFLAN